MTMPAFATEIVPVRTISAESSTEEPALIASTSSASVPTVTVTAVALCNSAASAASALASLESTIRPPDENLIPS